LEEKKMKALVLTLLLVVSSMAFGFPQPLCASPELISSDPKDGAQDVNPKYVNEEGIQFLFDKEVEVTDVIVEADKVNLNWDIPDFISKPAKYITFFPKSEDDMIDYGMQVSVTVSVKDTSGNEICVKISFIMIIGDTGKPKPN
jgi:hypothetical protein